ncbi:hypothetical protein NE237_020617 [Protea cynaroides]|uniref:Uncharacterized protein n=1 Tax=Protea cynaroides TaxID=273540 RepID=A0A9Q0K2R4_9MAGN|nr:hypothetical protein NE237_020617 [Protea cynaroides]
MQHEILALRTDLQSSSLTTEGSSGLQQQQQQHEEVYSWFYTAMGSINGGKIADRRWLLSSEHANQQLLAKEKKCAPGDSLFSVPCLSNIHNRRERERFSFAQRASVGKGGRRGVSGAKLPPHGKKQHSMAYPGRKAYGGGPSPSIYGPYHLQPSPSS